ncbi:MAG: hypothetical protein ABSG36_05485 [Acidimicrobiales bacterium]
MTTTRLRVRTGFLAEATRVDVPGRRTAPGRVRGRSPEPARETVAVRAALLARRGDPPVSRARLADERPGRTGGSPPSVARRALDPAFAPERALAPRPDGVTSLTLLG